MPLPRRKMMISIVTAAAGIIALLSSSSSFANAKLADRRRFDNARKQKKASPRRTVIGGNNKNKSNRPPVTVTDGAQSIDIDNTNFVNSEYDETNRNLLPNTRSNGNTVGSIRGAKDTTQQREEQLSDVAMLSLSDYEESQQQYNHRQLSSQLTGCCSSYKSYSAMDMCGLYGEDCESGEQPSHDSGDENCEQDGLSFIGISFSVNTAMGNPFSYQLCDQFPMENIIDRNYDYVMSMDEDGWLVGGGYKSFDFSGKMP